MECEEFYERNCSFLPVKEERSAWLTLPNVVLRTVICCHVQDDVILKWFFLDSCLSLRVS